LANTFRNFSSLLLIFDRCLLYMQIHIRCSVNLWSPFSEHLASEEFFITTFS